MEETPSLQIGSGAHQGSGLRHALWVSGAYLVAALSYAWVAAWWASATARTAPERGGLERGAVLAWVVVTSGLLLGLLLRHHRGRQRDAALLARMERAVMVNEQRALAGVMAASTAHDANNAMTVLLADLTGSPDDPDAGERRAEALACGQRIMEILRRLAVTQGAGGDEARSVDLGRLVQEAVDAARRHPGVGDCQVRVVGSLDAPVDAVPALVHQMVANLVINAGEATGGAGTIEVRLQPGPDGAHLEVHDDGPGVPMERRQTLFSSMLTTKPDGTGLGLFSVRVCAQVHGGRVDVGDSDLGGACFRVLLPQRR
ncbi:MAG: HAMP domain-containing histidine kinase [Deltaproteobacteria bacterium]|nr:HAMP domain-containing histidine kinase [Deltaproteobacteria bacterium]